MGTCSGRGPRDEGERVTLMESPFGDVLSVT
jgi:hypothetical protein